MIEVPEIDWDSEDSGNEPSGTPPPPYSSPEGCETPDFVLDRHHVEAQVRAQELGLAEVTASAGTRPKARIPMASSYILRAALEGFRSRAGPTSGQQEEEIGPDNALCSATERQCKTCY